MTMPNWNFGTMLIHGKMQEIGKEIMKCEIDIIAIQEIRRQGQGRIDKPDCTALYGGLEEKTSQLGTGFIMNKTMERSLLDFKPQNKKICKIRQNGRFRNIAVTSSYAPHIILCTHD